jgi:hypothetical protein
MLPKKDSSSKMASHRAMPEEVKVTRQKIRVKKVSTRDLTFLPNNLTAFITLGKLKCAAFLSKKG